MKNPGDFARMFVHSFNLHALTRYAWQRLALAPAVVAVFVLLIFISPATAQRFRDTMYNQTIGTYELPFSSRLMMGVPIFSANPTPPLIGSAVPCSAVPGSNLTSYCNAPRVTITCGGPIGSATDGNGEAINWTFTNGNNVCVTVTYNFSYNDARQTCSFYFYVPKGHATTTIKATLSNGTHESLNEAPVDGWQHWFDATGITSLTFTDANGTTGQELGWGSDPRWSMERICSL